MSNILNKILKSKKSGMPADKISHKFALKILRDMIVRYAGNEKVIQLSDQKYFVEEISSKNVASVNQLKNISKSNSFLFVHSPSQKIVDLLLKLDNKPQQIGILTHNFFSADNILTRIGRTINISSSKTDRFLETRKLIKQFHNNGYRLVFDRGSFFGSKMLLILFSPTFQKKMEQRLQKLERFFGKSPLRNLSRNRMLVFVNDTYSLNSKNKLTNTYLSETINFDEKYNINTFCGKFYLENVKLLFKVSKPKKNSNVLDLGTGTGTFALNAAMRGASVYALDISELMISKAKDKATKMGLDKKIKFVCADAENLPFKSNFFDIIYTASVPHDVNNFDKYLKEIHRVLKKNGTVYMNLYNFFTPAGLYWIINIVLGRIQKLNFISRSILNNKAKTVGLKIVGRYGIELFQGLPIPWKIRWKIFSKHRSLERKLSFSKLNFVYSQFYYILKKTA